jgi:membrane-associated phospholipid phosphatase
VTASSEIGWSGTMRARVEDLGRTIRTTFVMLLGRPRRPPPRFVPVWRRLWPQALGVAGAIALSMALIDAPVFHAAAGLPPSVVDFFYVITDFGQSGWILFPAGGLFAILLGLSAVSTDRFARGVLAIVMARVGFVFIAVGLPGLIDTIVKRWIGRVRPSALGPFAYEPFSWRPEFASFPSGHATTAFAALVAIGAVLPRLRPLLWTYALLIAASRIAVVAHYPSDVMGGAAFGAFGALWVRDWFARRRLGFHIGADGKVRAGSGPSWRRLKRVAGALVAP